MLVAHRRRSEERVAEVATCRQWIGRQEVREEETTAYPPRALKARLEASCAGEGATGDAFPPLWHWLYFLPRAPASALGPDGHPRRGGFLPPVNLPRRMRVGIRALRPLIDDGPFELRGRMLDGHRAARWACGPDGGSRWRPKRPWRDRRRAAAMQAYRIGGARSGAFPRRSRMRIERLDHLVLTVADIERSCAFYTRVMGLREVNFAGGRKALAFGDQKINPHRAGHELEPRALAPTPGSADLCFIAAAPLAEVVATLTAAGVEIEEGPVARTGAIGPIRSVYFHDPDGNLIEVSNPLP